MMIRPAADLQKDWKGISDYCKEFNKPVYLTEDGAGEYVLLQLDRYEALLEEIDIVGKVLSSEADYYRDGISYSMDEVRQMLREVIDGAEDNSKESAA